MDAPDNYSPEAVLDSFQGDAVMEIHKYLWSMESDSNSYDTTYIDTILLINEGSSVRIKYPKDNISKRLSFVSRDSVAGIDYYYGHEVTPSTACRLYLHYSTDSIFLINREGGLGIANFWEMKGKK